MTTGIRDNLIHKWFHIQEDPSKYCYSCTNYLQATELLCSLGDPMKYTGSKLVPFVFHINTAGAFKPPDLPMSDAPLAGVSGANKTSKTLKQALPARRKPHRNRRTATEDEETTPIMLTNDSVTIFAEVFSGNDDLDPWNNKVSITYKLQLAAKIDVSY